MEEYRSFLLKLQSYLNDVELPSSKEKPEWIDEIRQAVKDPDWNQWIDSVIGIKSETNIKGEIKKVAKFPRLTGGSGGNVGPKDLGAVYSEALQALFDVETGDSIDDFQNFFLSSLLGKSFPGTTINLPLNTQFNPNADFRLAYRATSSRDYRESGGSSIAIANPVDSLLLLEGLIAFSSIEKAKHELDETEQVETQIIYSLACDITAGASVNAAHGELNSEEIWLPEWSEPQTYQQLRALLRDRQYPLPKQDHLDTLDVAQEFARWAPSEGISAFNRFAFYPRKGQSRFGIHNGTFIPGQSRSDLPSALKNYRKSVRWLANSSGLQAIELPVRALEHELYALATGAGNHLEVLIQLAEIEMALSVTSAELKFGPLWPLNSKWIDAAIEDEGDTPELRLGLAIASLGYRNYFSAVTHDGKSWVFDFDKKLYCRSSSLIQNLIALQRRLKVDEITTIKNPVMPSCEDIYLFLSGCLNERRIDAIARGFSLCRIQQRSFSPINQTAVALLPPIYQLSAVTRWRHTPDKGLIQLSSRSMELLALRRSQDAFFEAICAIQRSGEMVSLYRHFEDCMISSDRIAAALAFPLTRKQINQLQYMSCKSVT